MNMNKRNTVVTASLLAFAWCMTPRAWACRIVLTNDTGVTYFIKEETGGNTWQEVAPGGQAVVGSHEQMPTFVLGKGKQEPEVRVVQIACGRDEHESANKDKSYSFSGIIERKLPQEMFDIQSVTAAPAAPAIAEPVAQAPAKKHGCGCKHE